MRVINMSLWNHVYTLTNQAYVVTVSNNITVLLMLYHHCYLIEWCWQKQTFCWCRCRHWNHCRCCVAAAAIGCFYNHRHYLVQVINYWNCIVEYSVMTYRRHEIIRPRCQEMIDGRIYIWINSSIYKRTYMGEMSFTRVIAYNWEVHSV